VSWVWQRVGGGSREAVGAGTDCCRRGGYSAVESEAKARAEGKITFKRTAKAMEGAASTEGPARKKKKAVRERAGAVKKPNMLSFDEED